MNLKALPLAAAALCVAATVSTAANAAATFGVTYFQVPTGTGGDFDICCGSPPATMPVIALGSSLGADGLPITTLAAASGGVVNQDASGQILWWKAGGAVSFTGTGTLPLPLPLTNMYAPNGTGANDASFFLTAILSGTFTGSGAAASLSVAGDDDVLVYLDGKYIGGQPGIHGTVFSTIDLGVLTGAHSLTVFYADRAQVGAQLQLEGIGLETLTPGGVVPEPATWAMMLAGFGAAGALLRRRRVVA